VPLLFVPFLNKGPPGSLWMSSLHGGPMFCSINNTWGHCAHLKSIEKHSAPCGPLMSAICLIFTNRDKKQRQLALHWCLSDYAFDDLRSKFNHQFWRKILVPQCYCQFYVLLGGTKGIFFEFLAKSTILASEF